MIVERLARALWEVVDYSRGFEWDEVHPDATQERFREQTREHYRDRARTLLKQFDVKERSEVHG